jgi:hypothetical protein
MNNVEKIRKAVIMACHPECKTYEEALWNEFRSGSYRNIQHKGEILTVECVKLEPKQFIVNDNYVSGQSPLWLQ